MIEKTLTVKSETGLHARPAAELVNLCKAFKCELKLYKGNDRSKTYQPKSIISIMTIGASKGDEVTFVADGEDEGHAIEQLTALFSTAFGE